MPATCGVTRPRGIARAGDLGSGHAHQYPRRTGGSTLRPRPSIPSPVPSLDARHVIPSYSFREAARLERELGVSHVLAQVLVRRGMGAPDAAPVPRGGRLASARRVWRAARCGRADPRSRRPRLADHRPRRLRRRRRVLHGRARARAAHARRPGRLVSAAPHRRRLRPGGGDRRAPGGPRHEPAGDGRLRDHRGRRGRRTRAPRAWTSWWTDHHSPRADGALPGAPDRPPGGRRLPVPRPLRHRGGVQARSGAARRRRAAIRARPTRTSTSSRSRRWPTSSRSPARTARW